MTPNLCNKTAAPGNSLSIKVNLLKTVAFSCFSETKRTSVKQQKF